MWCFFAQRASDTFALVRSSYDHRNDDCATKGMRSSYTVHNTDTRPRSYQRSVRRIRRVTCRFRPTKPCGRVLFSRCYPPLAIGIPRYIDGPYVTGLSEPCPSDGHYGKSTSTTFRLRDRCCFWFFTIFICMYKFMLFVFHIVSWRYSICKVCWLFCCCPSARALICDSWCRVLSIGIKSGNMKKKKKIDIIILHAFGVMLCDCLSWVWCNMWVGCLLCESSGRRFSAYALGSFLTTV